MTILKINLIVPEVSFEIGIAITDSDFEMICTKYKAEIDTKLSETYKTNIYKLSNNKFLLEESIPNKKAILLNNEKELFLFRTKVLLFFDEDTKSFESHSHYFGRDIDFILLRYEPKRLENIATKYNIFYQLKNKLYISLNVDNTIDPKKYFTLNAFEEFTKMAKFIYIEDENISF